MDTQFILCLVGAVIFGIVVYYLMHRKTNKEDAIYTTPKGYKVIIPNNIVPIYGRNFTVTNQKEAVSLILSWVDIRIEECLASYPSDRATLEKLAKRVNYEIINDYMFPCSQSDTGMCAGFTNLSTVFAPLYCKWSGNESPTFQTHPKLVRTKETIASIAKNNRWLTEGKPFYASDLENRNGMEIGIPVICHELEHVWGKITADHKKVE